MTASQPQHVAVDLEALERLLEKATPGPWRALDKMPRINRHRQWDHEKDPTGTVEIANFGDWGDTEIRPLNGARWLADAHLTVAAVNALPALISELKSLRERAGGGGADHSGDANDMIPALPTPMGAETGHAGSIKGDECG